MYIKPETAEFYKLCAKLGMGNVTTVKKWWKTIYEVIIRELYINGSVYVPLLGHFRLKHEPASIQKQVDKDGIVHWYDVSERDRPRFYPEDDFINDVNMRGVTKSYRLRVRLNKRTQRDKERDARFKEIEGKYEEVVEKNVLKQLEDEDRFAKLIKEKRKYYEESLEKELMEENET